MPQIDRSFVGEGVIYARAYQSQDPLLDIGNCDSFSIAFATDRATLPNYRGGGGNRNVRQRVTDVTATIGMFDLTATNLARVTRSTVVANAAAAVTGEARTAAGVEGELIPLKYLPDLSKAVTVKTPGSSGVTLVAGKDYLLTQHGLIVTSGTSITAAGVVVDYTRLAVSAVQLLNGSQVELELFIAGLNDAQSGEPYSLRPRRVKFGLLSELPVFGTEYLRLEGPAELLADERVTDTTLSKFCEMQLVNKVA